MLTTKKVFLITGASSGIGAETAKEALQAGYRVVMAARSKGKLHALADRLGSSSDVGIVECDVTDWESQAAMFHEAMHQFGRIDVVFANAGLESGSSFLGEEDTPEEWRQMILTNVYGAAVTARLALPELIKTAGHFILTGSVAGRVAIPGNLYSSTKWAVTGMAESIRKQVSDQGVRVTLVEPGMVDTPFWKEKPNVPMLKPEDVAYAILFAVGQPAHIDINEILVRPRGQSI